MSKLVSAFMGIEDAVRKGFRFGLVIGLCFGFTIGAITAFIILNSFK